MSNENAYSRHELWRKTGRSLLTGAALTAFGLYAGSLPLSLIGVFFGGRAAILLAVYSDWDADISCLVPDGAHPLTYWLDTKSVWLDDALFDADDVAMHRLPKPAGQTYVPERVAWYALMRLNRFARTGHADDRAAFMKQVGWLRKRVGAAGRVSPVWPNEYEFTDDGRTFAYGTYSLAAQALATSAFVRAFRLDGDREWLELALGAAGAITADRIVGGFLTTYRGEKTLLAYSPPSVVFRPNPCLAGMLALHDVFAETGAEEIGNVLAATLRGVRRNIDEWDWRGMWTRGDGCRYLPEVFRHATTRELLRATSVALRDDVLEIFARRYAAERMSPAARVAVKSVHAARGLLGAIRRALPDPEKWRA